MQFLDHVNGLTKTRTPLPDAVKLQQIFADPRNKNLDVSIPPASPSDGMPDTGSGRRRRRSDDDEAARLDAQMDRLMQLTATSARTKTTTPQMTSASRKE